MTSVFGAGFLCLTPSAASQLEIRVHAVAKVVKTFGDSRVAETLDEFRYPKIKL